MNTIRVIIPIIMISNILLVSCLGKTACEKKLDNVLKHFENEQYEEAISLCNAMEVECEDVPYLYYYRGSSYYNLNKNKQAIEDYTTLLNFKDQEEVGYMNRSFCYYNMGEYQLAMNDIRVFETKFGMNEEVSHQYGLNYKGLGVLDSAMYWYNYTISSSLPNADYLASRALLYAAMHDTIAARTDAQKSLALAKDDIYAASKSRVALARVASKVNALKILEEAVELDPNSEFVNIALAFAYLDLDNFEKAISLFRKNISLENNAINNHNLANTFIGDKEIDSALLYFSKAIELESNSIFYLNRAMYCYLPTHQFEEAIADFKMGIKLDPSHPYNYNNLGYALYKIGKYDEAKENVTYSLDVFDKNSYAYKNLALIELATGEKKKATESAQKSLDLGYPEIDEEFDSLVVILGLDLSERKVLNFLEINKKVSFRD